MKFFRNLTLVLSICCTVMMGNIIRFIIVNNASAIEFPEYKETTKLDVSDILRPKPPIDNTSAELKNQIDARVEIEWHLDDPDEVQIEYPEGYEEIEYETTSYDGYTYEDTTYVYEDASYDTATVGSSGTFDWSAYGSYHPTDGLTPEGGINFYDNGDGNGERMETAYSSNVLYHYRTSEWVADSEGFYHDSEGRYVVAASDMPQGTVFQTSKGEAIVLDCGCSDGVTDFYVNW